MKKTQAVARLLFVGSVALFACTSEHTDYPAGKRPPAAHLSCTTDTDCYEITRTLRCCSGCGATPDRLIAVNRAGFDARRLEETRACSKKTCPHFICPVRNECVDSSAVCRKGQCRQKVTRKPGCKE